MVEESALALAAASCTLTVISSTRASCRLAPRTVSAASASSGTACSDTSATSRVACRSACDSRISTIARKATRTAQNTATTRPATSPPDTICAPSSNLGCEHPTARTGQAPKRYPQARKAPDGIRPGLSDTASAGVVLDDELLVADHRDLAALRLAVQAEGQGLQVDLEVLRGLALARVAALTGDHERGLLLGPVADGDHVAGLHLERRAVDLAPVDLDVAVDDHLAGLVDGAGDARTQHQGVETGLELGDQRLTGLALDLAGTVEGARELGLAQVVLRAQALLLEQTDLVVAVLLAAAAVLPGRVRAGLEVLDGLRGQ